MARIPSSFSKRQRLKRVRIKATRTTMFKTAQARSALRGYELMMLPGGRTVKLPTHDLEAAQKAFKQMAQAVTMTSVLMDNYDYKPKQVLKLAKSKPEFFEACKSGKYIYLDGKIVLRDSSAIRLINNRLTLMEHPSPTSFVRGSVRLQTIKTPILCARKREVPVPVIGAEMEGYGIAYDYSYKTVTKTKSELISIDQPAGVKTSSALTAEAMSTFVASYHQQPNYLGDALKRHMTEKKMTVARLAELAGVSTRTVQRMRTEGYRPKLRSIVSVCLALNLYPNDSILLLQFAGYKLTDSDEDGVFMFLLTMCYQCSMKDINRFMDSMNLRNFEDCEK